MKILTWNINHRSNDHSLQYVIEQEKADLIFLQECFHPLTYLTKRELKELSNKYSWEPTRNGWGNFILSKNETVSEILLDHEFKGRLLVSKVILPTFGEMTLINFHTPITGQYSRYNLEKMFQIAKEHILKGNTIICGDLNIGECFDKNGKTECTDVLNKIFTDYNIIDCYRKFNSEIGQTFRPARNPNSLICIDYIFATKDLESRVRNCQIVVNDQIKQMSDHHPLVAVIE